MSDPMIATAYLQVRKARYGWSVESRVIKSTQTKPEIVEPGCIVVKVKLRIPPEAWGPFEPEAVIDVPADLVQHAVEIEAVDAQ